MVHTRTCKFKMADMMANIAMASSVARKSTSLFSPSQRLIEASSQVGYHDQPGQETKVRKLSLVLLGDAARNCRMAPLTDLVDPPPPSSSSCPT